MFYATLEGPLLLPLFGWLVYYQIVQACACQSTARVHLSTTTSTYARELQRYYMTHNKRCIPVSTPSCDSPDDTVAQVVCVPRSPHKTLRNQKKTNYPFGGTVDFCS